MDVSVSQGQNEDVEELKRLKALKDQGFRRVGPQTMSVQKPLTPMYFSTEFLETEFH